MSSYFVVTNKGIAGKAVKYPGGWRFIPWNDAHQRGRKLHSSAFTSVPAWVGKHSLIPDPDSCPTCDGHAHIWTGGVNGGDPDVHPCPDCNM